MPQGNRYKIKTPEKLCKEIVKYYLKDWELLFNYRPDWLKNPETKKNLELDIYIPQIGLAIEIQGIHHQTIYQMKKDKLKEELCELKDTRIFKIEKIEHIFTLIYKHLLPISKKKYIPYFIKNKIHSTEGYYNKLLHNLKNKKWSDINNKYFKYNIMRLYREKGVKKQNDELESVKIRRALRASN